MVTGHCPGRVPPFGHPWINAYLRLPMAFRSLSRPSSAISALASTLRSFSLDLASFRSRPLLRLFRDRAARASFIAFPCAVFKVRSPAAFNLPPTDPLTGQSSGPLKTSGLSPRLRDSSKRYRNLPKRSGHSCSLDARVLSFRQFLAASRRILPFLRSRFRARFSGCRSIPASPSAFALCLPASPSAVDLGFARVQIPQSCACFPASPQPSPLSLERR